MNTIQSTDGIPAITLKKREKRSGLATIYKTIRKKECFDLIGDCVIVQAIINTLDEHNKSYSKNELYRLSKIMTDDDRSAIREYMRPLIKKADSTIHW